jgi:hypothetical protein
MRTRCSRKLCLPEVSQGFPLLSRVKAPKGDLPQRFFKQGLKFSAFSKPAWQRQRQMPQRY